MLNLARLADRGPMAAAAIAASLLALSLLLPAVVPTLSLMSLPLVVGSAAIVAFVVLRRGGTAALRVTGFCLVMLAVLSFVLFGTAVSGPLVALALWLPAVLSAVVLRHSVSLDLAVLATTLWGLLTALGMELAVGGRPEIWREAIEVQLGDPERTGLTEEQFVAFVETLASRMSGATGVSVMLVALCALFLGRAWQAAAVDRPGGFREEFHALSLGKGPAIACLALITAAFVFEGTLWDAFAFVAVVAFAVQGLAVAHATVARRGMAKGWLVGLYLMLLLPHTVLLLAALGLADNVFPLRGPATPSA